MSAVVLVGLLVAAGVWFVGAPDRVRTVLGFVLLGHAANVLILMASSGSGTGVPLLGVGDDPVDPLPQAFVLTAIVISFGVTALLLALAAALHGDDDEADDPIAPPAADDPIAPPAADDADAS